MRRAARLIPVLVLVLSGGPAAVHAEPADSILPIIAALLPTSPSEAEVDAVLGSLTDRAAKDRAVRYRYGATIRSMFCEITPGYGLITDSLDFVLVDFRTEAAWMTDLKHKYDALKKDLRTIYGKPSAEFDGKRALEQFRIDVRQSAWSTDGGSCVLVLEGAGRDEPRLGVLFLGRAAADSLTRADAERRTDRRDQPRAWMDWARSRFITRFAFDYPGYSVDPALPVFDPAADTAIDVAQVPVLLKHGRPKYPERAVQNRASGTVWIQAFVGIDGKVVVARVLKSSGKSVGFDEAALAAAYKNEFSPAIGHDGQPVGVWISYMVDFEIRR